jgi:pyrrolidone-carboxylate peptidase
MLKLRLSDMSRPNTVWGFAYSRRNLGVTTLYSIEQFDFRYLIFPNNIDRYLEKIQIERPNLIIGLGMTRTGKSIKVEGICKNNFGQKQIDKDQEINTEVQISASKMIQKLPQGFIFAETIGNSYCNLMSWKIQQLIEQNNLQTKLVFIHIPKKSDKELLERGIQSIVGQLQV